MSNSKMLIDAAHPEETRVVVLKGNRIEEFDFESESKKQLRGNIYLAKVTRVEPSLQAAFVEYGGNRHGFLAFSEIHPDYYQIPFADRQALLEEEARTHRDEEDEPREARGRRGGEGRGGEGRSADAPREGGEGRAARGEGRGERGGRNERGQRRSRRHRRDNVSATALDRRGPADDSISEAVPGFEEAAELPAPGEEIAAAASDAAADDGAPLEAEHGLDAVPGPAAREDEMPSFDVPAEASAEPVREIVDADPPATGNGTPLESEASPDVVEPVAVVEAEEIAAAVPQMELAEPVAAGDEVPPSEGAAPAADEGPDDAGDLPPEADARAEVRESSDALQDDAHAPEHEEEHVEQIGGDALSDVAPRPVRVRRHYKIQEVIKRRQILLIQVVKEERGNKGAALTTYLSLAGRYSVLMPNTAKGGGISRKITDGEDRKRLKAIAGELDVPDGMGVILRTAGASRSPVEVRRDFEYLLRMWESVRELTLKSSAPSLVYEEGSLIKRTIRDLYSQDIGEIVVSGEAGYAEARDFMRMLMPGNAATVQPYRDAAPIFAKSGVEAQLDAMFSAHVTLKSGGYLVINQTEALVAIDVNSGRSTREHNIEDTALRTNLEAADEVARQLRLRDLAGLIVVDFIDMEEGRNNRAVERRLKDALKNDRARIQIGRISHFGLLEMSRQRMRTGVLEGSTVVCPHCAGTGTVRSTSSIALHVLRLVEDALIKDATYDLVVRSRAEVALYMLNQKRAKLVELEQRFGVTVTVASDPTLTGTVYHAIERGDLATRAEAPAPRPERVRVDSVAPIFEPEAEDEPAEVEAAEIKEDGVADAAADEAGEGERRRRRRRRRRGGRDREAGSETAVEDSAEAQAESSPGDADEPFPAIGFTAEPREVETADAVAPEAPAETGAPVADATVEPEPAAAVAAVVPGEAMVSGEPPASDGPAEAEPAVEEAPKRRRSRRAAPRSDEAAVVDAPATAEEAPKRRRTRRAAAPVLDAPEAAPAVAESAPAADLAAPPAEPVGARPSADRDVGADTVEHHPAEAGEAGPSPEPAGDAAALFAPAEAGEPAPVEPERPKRSGWWQRAKTSFGG